MEAVQDLLLDGDLEPSVQGLLLLLMGCYECAAIHACSVWKFALEVGLLRQLGISDTVLLHALKQGYVVYRAEASPPGLPGRPGEPRTYAALTEEGAARAWQLADTHRGSKARRAPAPNGRKSARQKPSWDRKRRQLWLGDTLLLHLHRRAPNQEQILDAFQETGWPARVDDPLVPRKGIDRRECLRVTLKDLNRGQRPVRVCFWMEADGEGIGWDLAD